MSESHSSSLSPITRFTGTVYPLLDASLNLDFQNAFKIHTTFIHPWSTFFGQMGPCSKKNIAPSGATGTGSLDSIVTPTISKTFIEYYARNI